jgi:2'-5' RNA ligase
VTIIRAFLSVNLSIEVLRAITVAQREARERCAAAGWSIAWVPPPNEHVILRYLGEISVALPQPLVTAMRAHVEPLPPFPLRASGLRARADEAKTPDAPPTVAATGGTTRTEAAGTEAAGTEAPGPEAPRLQHSARIVVQLADETGGLERLQAALVAPLQDLGFRPFEPRPITEMVVGRVVAAGSTPLDVLLAPAAEIEFGSSLVMDVLLYKSTAHAPRGEYVRLGYVSLLGHSPGLADAARRAAPGGVVAIAGAATLAAAAGSCAEPPELEAEPLDEVATDLAEPQIVELAEPDDEEVLYDEVVADEVDADDDEDEAEEEPPADL